MVRLQFRDLNEAADNKSVEFLNSQRKVDKSAIALAASNLADGTPNCSTILTQQFICENKVSLACKTISAILEASFALLD